MNERLLSPTYDFVLYNKAQKQVINVNGKKVNLQICLCKTVGCLANH